LWGEVVAASEGVMDVAHANAAVAAHITSLAGLAITDDMDLLEYSQKSVHEIVKQAVAAKDGAKALGDAIDKTGLDSLEKGLTACTKSHLHILNKGQSVTTQFHFNFLGGPSERADVALISGLGNVARSLYILTEAGGWESLGNVYESAVELCKVIKLTKDMDQNFMNLTKYTDQYHLWITSVPKLPDKMDTFGIASPHYTALRKVLVERMVSVESHVVMTMQEIIKDDLESVECLSGKLMAKLPKETQELVTTAKICKCVPKGKTAKTMDPKQLQEHVISMNQLDSLDLALAGKLLPDIKATIGDMRDSGIDVLKTAATKFLGDIEAALAVKEKFKPILAAVAKWSFDDVTWMFDTKEEEAKKKIQTEVQVLLQTHEFSVQQSTYDKFPHLLVFNKNFGHEEFPTIVELFNTGFAKMRTLDVEECGKIAATMLVTDVFLHPLIYEDQQKAIEGVLAVINQTAKITSSVFDEGLKAKIAAVCPATTVPAKRVAGLDASQGVEVKKSKAEKGKKSGK